MRSVDHQFEIEKKGGGVLGDPLEVQGALTNPFGCAMS